MTLKQFFQVAGGALVGLLFYSTGLHGLIKWPLILISVGLGAAMAFLPFEERPLEKWIIAFFRSIYSPTVYTWKKSDKAPVYYTENSPAPAVDSKVSAEYLASTPQAPSHAKLESAEKSFLSKLTSMLSLGGTSADTKPVAQTVTTPTPQTALPTTNSPLNIPTQLPTLVKRSAPKLIIEERPKLADTSAKIRVEEVLSPQQKQEKISSKAAEFSIDAAPPNPPTIANTVTGQVIDQDRKIIAGAIMEIKDEQGRPVRALKSNMAGHFIIVTPLLNGKYEIQTEHDGFKFEPVSFETTGEIIPPIAIRGAKLEGGIIDEKQS